MQNEGAHGVATGSWIYSNSTPFKKVRCDIRSVQNIIIIVWQHVSAKLEVQPVSEVHAVKKRTAGYGVVEYSYI